jgi:translocator protein
LIDVRKPSLKVLNITNDNKNREIIMQPIQSNYFRYLNLVAFVATVVINSLAGSTTTIGGKFTAQVSDANPTLITPAGYVFSIWGIIYVLLGIFAIYQALPKNKDRPFQKQISFFFILSCIANIVWLFAWQYEQLPISVGLMLILLASLIAIYQRVGIGKTKTSIKEKLAIHLPFSVYLGWITIATIANISATLVNVGWDGAGLDPTTWAIIIVAVALLITMLSLALRKDIPYALVIIWALVGISAKQTPNQTIVTLTQASAIIIAVAIAVTAVAIILLKKRQKS